MPTKTSENDPAAIKGWIADARKKPISFAMLVGPNGIVFQADRVKSPDQMRKAAKAAGGGGKGCWGKLTVEQKLLRLTYEGNPPGGFEKQVRKMLSEAGFPMQIAMQSLADAETSEETPDTAEADGSADGMTLTSSATDAEEGDPTGPPGRTGGDGADTALEDGDANPDSEGDEEEDSPDLATAIKIARKKPLNFACMLADQGVVLVTHRRRNHGILVKEAKGAGGSAKGAWGTFAVEGKVVVLTCIEDPPGTLARRLKLHLRDNGLKYAVALRSPSGEVTEPEDDPEPTARAEAKVESAAMSSSPTPQPADPATDAVKRALETVSQALAKSFSKKEMLQFKPLRAEAMRALKAGDVPAAQQCVDQMRAALPATAEPPGDDSGGMSMVRETEGGSSSEPEVILASMPEESVPQDADPDALPDDNTSTELVPGAKTGNTLAVLRGREVKAKNRVSRTFPSREAAAAFARSLRKPAALAMEGGTYVVYVVDMPTSWYDTTDLELSDIGDAATPDQSDTDLYRRDGTITTLITEDDHVVNFGEFSAGRVDRTGSTKAHNVESSPFAGHLQAFGPGLKDIKDEDTFNRQFEIAMRDVAYEMVDKAGQAARDMQNRLSGTEMSEEDRTTMMKVLREMQPVDAKMEELRAKISSTRSRRIVYTHPRSPKSGTDEAKREIAKIDAEVAALNKELEQMKLLRAQIAQPFPLVLRMGDSRDFMNKSEEDQFEELKDAADEVVENVEDTKEDLDDGDFDLWTHPGIVATTMAGLGVEGQQAGWAKDKAEWEATEDAAWAIGEAVLTIGLAVGALFVPGPGWVALAMGGASLAVGGASAVSMTGDYMRKDAAANIGLDPMKGMISQEEVPHWGWVAAAWVGLGLDAAGVASTIKAIKAAKSTAEALQMLKESGEAAKLAKLAGVPPAKVDNFIETVLKPALMGKYAGNLGEFKTAMIGDELFENSFGSGAAEAVTLIRKNDGVFDVEIVTRSGTDPARRLSSVTEETRHLSQVLDPKNAKDVERLTEEALAKWPETKPLDRIEAMKSQARLELESQQMVIDELRRGLPEGIEDAPDALRMPGYDAKLADLQEAQGRAARYQAQLGKLDEVAGEVKAGNVPAWLDRAPPPRLFSDPKYLETNKDALAYFKANGGGIDEVPEGHYFVEKAGGPANGGHYELRRFAEGSEHFEDVAPVQVAKKGDGWETTAGTRKTASETRAEIETVYGEALRNTELETAITSAFTDPYKAAYARKYADAFKELSDRGVSYSDALAGLDSKTVAAFDGELRKQLRAKAIGVVNEVEGKARMTRLTEFMDAMPDNGSRGALFSDFRAANMSDELTAIDKTPNATRLAGQTKMGDGIVEVPAKPPASGLDPDDMATIPGPVDEGRYLAEDKSGQAFRSSQAKNYLNKLFEGDGALEMADGQSTRGVAYFFDSADEAKKAVKDIQKMKPEGFADMPMSQQGQLDQFRSQIHVGYYMADGTLVWLK